MRYNSSEQVLLSFVVPCYNVEKYIQRCLDSIYACDLSEQQFEVICINDCSPDNVQEILERNRLNHNNLKIVVHEKNRGLGGARNTGIKQAIGRYIWFVDSDDTIIGKDLKALLQKVVAMDVDVFCFNYQQVDDQGNVLSKRIVFDDNNPENGYMFAEKVFKPEEKVYHIGYVWRFIYRTEYLRSHRLFFPENVCWEDTVYMPKAILEAERVASFSDVMYSYWTNAESISNTFSKTYPARLIFEYAFCAGGNLLYFSEEIKDSRLKKAFRNKAIEHYINGFAIYLFRTNKFERKKFYEIIKKSDFKIKPLRCKMHILEKLLVNRAIGPFLAEIGVFVYGVTHRSQKINL